MLGIKKRDTKQVFKAIAHQQGVSVSEVKERIQSTIDEIRKICIFRFIN